MSKQGMAIIAALCACIGGFVAAGFFVGWNGGAALIALGCGLGAYLGGQFRAGRDRKATAAERND
jgi:membrane protein implicated in regulation of membrane protease activity